MLSRQVFGRGEIIAIPLPNIGSMGGEYGRSEGTTAENAVPFPGAARRLLDLLSTDGRDTGGWFMNEIARSKRIKNVVSLQWPVSVVANQEAVRIGMSPRDYLSGSKPRMHSFEAVWWNSCSRLKHCAMHSAFRSPQLKSNRCHRPSGHR